MIIDRFGLHVAPGDIAFLVQPRGTVNLISPQLYSPFQLQIRPRTLRCPHDIDLNQQVDLPDWVDHPLARIFHPTPRQPGEKAGLLHDPNGEALPLIERLCRLSSPTHSLINAIWWAKASARRQQYGVTNLGPLVWTAVEMNHVRQAEAHIAQAEATGRRILLVARQQLPIFHVVERLEPFDLPHGEPMEAIGATLLRRYMLGAAPR